MNHYLSTTIIIINIVSNSFGHYTKQDPKWSPMTSYQNYVPDNYEVPHQKDFGSNYDYTNVVGNSYYPGSTKDVSPQSPVQQFPSTQYQTNTQDTNRNSGYMTGSPYTYQFPLTTQPTYQYLSPQTIPAKSPKSKVSPQYYYYYMVPTSQNSASNYNQNTYSNIDQTNQYSPVANSGFGYKYSSQPQTATKNMYYVNDGYNKVPGSNTHGLNSRMYSLESRTGYDARNQRYNLYEDRYYQQAAANDQMYYVYMPVKDTVPMYYTTYASNNVASVPQY